LAKPFYEKGIILVGQDPAIIEKNKKNLAEAYQYLGLYYGNTGDINCSKSAWNKVLQLDPTNKIYEYNQPLLDNDKKHTSDESGSSLQSPRH
jgi:tetratricopeptide (TPR) repeat protein